ncbi:MAG: hypothetical protein IIA14_00595 [SAR324 cluster bacterium]|nr:hypothetical protein [SAR324 cluster bacterium]
MALDAGTAWSASFALNEGSNSISVTSKDAAGNESGAATGTIVLDTTAPADPTLNAVTTPTATTPQTLSGGKDANSSIWIDGSEVVTADATTTWSYSAALSEGVNNFSITSKDALGNESFPAVTTSITLDTQISVVVISSPASSPVTTDTNDLTIQGNGPSSCESGGTVNLAGDDTQSTTCSSGAYSFTISKFVNATYTFNLAQTDPAGNTSGTVTQVWNRAAAQPAAPTITTTNPLFTNTSPTSVGGACESTSAAHTVNLSGAQSAATACASSAYSFTNFLAATADGNYSYLVSQTHNTTLVESDSVAFTWVFDTVGPAAIAISDPVASPVSTSGDTIDITGTCEAEATVNITGTDTSSFTCASGGTFTYTTGSQTSDADYTYNFAQTDQAGNTSDQTTQIWTRNSAVPATPVVTAPTSNPYYDNTTSATLDITVDCESSTPLDVTLDGGGNDVSNPAGTTTITSTCSGTPGSVTFSNVKNPGAEGTHAYEIFQFDASVTAPVVSASAGVTWIVDTTAPAKPTVVTPPPGTTFTAPSPLNIQGSCEAGIAVHLDADSDSAASIRSVTCNTDGTFTLQLLAADQSDNTTASYFIYQMDLALNQSATETITWARNDAALVPPTVTSPNLNPFTSNTASLTLLGTCNTGFTVRLRGVVRGTTTPEVANVTGTCVASGYELVVTGLGDESYDFTIDQTADGVTYSAGMVFVWIKDTTLPTLTVSYTPVVNASGTNPTNDSIFEFSSPDVGATIECKLDTGSYAACTSPKTYSGLTGSHSLLMRARDAAGNVSGEQLSEWTQTAHDTIALYHFDSGSHLTDSSNYVGEGEYGNALTDPAVTSATAEAANSVLGLGTSFAEARDLENNDGNYLVTAHDATHRGLRGTFTIEAFFKLESTPGNSDNRVLASKYDTTGQNGWEFGLLKKGNAVAYFTIIENNVATEYRSRKLGGKGADAFGAGKIYHMALTFNRGAITFYFEGALVSSKVHGTAGIALLPHTSADLRIGASEFASTYFWDGVIEEVRFSQIVRYSGSIYTIPTSPFTAD